MSKGLGEAIFSAYRQYGVVHVVASGQKPSPQTKVTIEELPFLIYPPRYALMFETDGITNPLVLPFQIEPTISNYPNVNFISISDKNGLHAVTIVEKPSSSSSSLVADPTAANFLVYKQIDTDHYLIAKADALVLAIYQKVFGPDTYANCQSYVASHSVVAVPAIGIVPNSLHAQIDRQPGVENGSKLIVTVDAIVEIDWTVNLVVAVPQGFNPLVKLLKFEIQLPPGPNHSNAMMKKTFRYEESPSQQTYTNVTIENGAQSVSAIVQIVV